MNKNKLIGKIIALLAERFNMKDQRRSPALVKNVATMVNVLERNAHRLERDAQRAVIVGILNQALTLEEFNEHWVVATAELILQAFESAATEGGE